MTKLTLEDIHTARLVMDHFGVPGSEIKNVVPLVQAARRSGLIHCQIVANVRGPSSNDLTDNLKRYLQMSPNERQQQSRRRA